MFDANTSKSIGEWQPKPSTWANWIFCFLEHFLSLSVFFASIFSFFFSSQRAKENPKMANGNENDISSHAFSFDTWTTTTCMWLCAIFLLFALRFLLYFSSFSFAIAIVIVLRACVSGGKSKIKTRNRGERTELSTSSKIRQSVDRQTARNDNNNRYENEICGLPKVEAKQTCNGFSVRSCPDENAIERKQQSSVIHPRIERKAEEHWKKSTNRKENRSKCENVKTKKHILNLVCVWLCSSLLSV